MPDNRFAVTLRPEFPGTGQITLLNRPLAIGANCVFSDIETGTGKTEPGTFARLWRESRNGGARTTEPSPALYTRICACLAGLSA
ncbi:MAG: hypothetical protein GDA53_09395 [Rhodobacteraceae bacterium]|nr:hypothetical protein [Paracoccaceae bacterium]